VREAEQFSEARLIRVTGGTITVRLDPVGMLEIVGSRAESGIRKTRNGESFGKYAQTVLTNDVNYVVFGPEKQKEYVMRKSTPTLTQSGLLAVLLQRQRYKIRRLVWRRGQRKHLRVAVWSTLTWPWRALTAPMPVRHSRRALGRIPLART
jgi:hypothetical protein